MKNIISIIICIILINILSVFANDASDSNLDISEETQIYAIYFNDFVKLRYKSEWKPKDKKLLVIKDKTYMHIPKDSSGNKHKDETKHYKFLVSFFKGVNILPDTFDDFWIKNQISTLLNCVIPIQYEYTFLTEELDRQPKGSNWEIFYKRFPNAESLGITTFSRVGFNKEKTQALLYVGVEAGPLYGVGHYILFEKINNEWKEVGRFRCWIS